MRHYSARGVPSQRADSPRTQAAFLSLYVQLPGLFGHNGLQPVDMLLLRRDPAFAQNSSQLLPEAMQPSLVWLFRAAGLSLDVWMDALCLLGACTAIAVAAGLHCAPLLAACWVLYLSFFSVGQTFLSFQWDILLLETGTLCRQGRSRRRSRTHAACNRILGHLVRAGAGSSALSCARAPHCHVDAPPPAVQVRPRAPAHPRGCRAMLLTCSCPGSCS